MKIRYKLEKNWNKVKILGNVEDRFGQIYMEELAILRNLVEFCEI